MLSYLLLLLTMMLFEDQLNSESIAKAKQKMVKVSFPGLSGSIPKDLNFSLAKFFYDDENIKGDFQNKVILQGPSGNGKTAFVNALAESMQLNTQIIRLNASELVTIMQDFALHDIRKAFESALSESGKTLLELGPSNRRKKFIIFIDKIELIENESEIRRSLKIHQLLLTYLEKIKDNKHIFVIFEAQDINKLNKDFLGKFKKHNVIEFANPDNEMRKEVIDFYLKKFEINNLSEHQIKKIIVETEGFTVGQVELLVQEAHDEAIRNSKEIEFEGLLELTNKYKKLDNKSNKKKEEQIKAESANNERSRSAYVIKDPEDIRTFDEVITEDIRSIISDLQNRDNLDYLPRKMIFNGPPGNGKSILAEKMAYAARAKFCLVDSSSLLTTFQGSASVDINRVFDECLEIAKQEPVFIFFDEIDKLVNSKKNKNDDKDSGTTTLWINIDKYLKNNKNIRIVFATNNLDALHKTLMDRYDKKSEVFTILNPNLEQRKQLFRFFFIEVYKTKINDERVIEYAALMSNGLSIRKIQLIVTSLINMAKRKKKKEVSLDELTKCINSNKPTYMETLSEWYETHKEFINNSVIIINTGLNVVNLIKNFELRNQFNDLSNNQVRNLQKDHIEKNHAGAAA